MTSSRPSSITHILVVEDDPHMQAEAAEAAGALGPVTVECAATKGDAERLARRRTFDMAIVDIGLPDGSGIDLIRELSRKHAPMICVARTVFDDDERLFGALAAGAQGYLLKGQPQESLRAQIQAAARGEPIISPAIARKVLAYFRGNPAFAHPAERADNPLTPREGEVLSLVGKGMTIAEAARALELSENTVKTHVKSAYGKLNVTSRAGAALEAKRLGLL